MAAHISAPAPAAVKARRRDDLRARLARAWPLYVMLIPGFVVLAVFSYYPMYGVVMAFQNYNPGLGFARSPWVGLANFERLLRTPNIERVVWNTLFLAVGKIVTVQLFAIAFALALNELRHLAFKRLAQTMVYLPYFLSWIVLGGILIDILGNAGIVNRALAALGLPKVLFLGSNTWFQPTMLVTNLWKEGGWATIIYLAALTGIDPQLYEAAAVDGASKWRRIWHIALPGITPIVILIACLSLGNVLNAGFEQVLTLYNPVVYATGDILDTFVYRAGILQAQYGLAAALGLIKSVIGMALVLLSWELVRRYTDYRIF